MKTLRTQDKTGMRERLPAEYLPAAVMIEEAMPSPWPNLVLWIIIALVGAFAAWLFAGRLDIVAVAEGRLIPRSQLKIVQPAEGGVMRELLVGEGERVRAGQVLARMDTKITRAETATIAGDITLRELQLRRIDAELAGSAILRNANDDPEDFAQADAQRDARVKAFRSSIAEERAVIARAGGELQAAQATRLKLAGTLRLLIEQESAYERLASQGYAGKLMFQQRRRERLEAAQDLRAQEHHVTSARAGIEQARRRMAQLDATYHARLRGERLEVTRELARLRQDARKLRHREELAQLRAPGNGIVKDLATHTPGSVLAPGTVLMTLVPEGESLVAEVWLRNADAGFVRDGQAAKIKLGSFPFQKYGMLEGEVLRVSADATERPGPRPELSYRALVRLAAQELRAGGERLQLLPGMQLSAEIRLGRRTVVEYLISPLQKIAHEAARER